MSVCLCVPDREGAIPGHARCDSHTEHRACGTWGHGPWHQHPTPHEVCTSYLFFILLINRKCYRTAQNLRSETCVQTLCFAVSALFLACLGHRIMSKFVHWYFVM